MMNQASMLEGVVPHGIGVDIEPISSINMESDTFLERNFTAAELAACRAKPDPRASLCARWCAKEAVVKALLSGTGEQLLLFFFAKRRTCSRSCCVLGVAGAASSPLHDIEVCNDEAGAPFVRLHGDLLS